MDEKNIQSIMNLIIYGGDGRSSAMEAIQAAKKGDFELAEEKLKAADQSLLEAHHSQTEMLTQEANGNSVEVSLLMVHGQDHLMTGMMFRDLAKEIVYLYRTLKEKSSV
ncbi:MAG TPA: PTS lactose/cellobiose transporter subunit IIA [Candidatus Mediterraneibacter pullistercoris]|nr:PTS lactose/cellobiose transporter subunit IIA [Candidatus Mediterraneibacter pullistercoris]